MLKTALANWKTTSAGLSAILLSAVHIAFCIHTGTLSESTLAVQIPIILGGLGLIAAHDGDQPSPALQQLQDRVDAIHKAVVTGDTSIIENPNTPTNVPK